jgi:hypothetical protein
MSRETTHGMGEMTTLPVPVPVSKVGKSLHNLGERERVLHLPLLEVRVELLQGGAVGSDDEPNPRRGNDVGGDRCAAFLTL